MKGSKNVSKQNFENPKKGPKSVQTHIKHKSENVPKRISKWIGLRRKFYQIGTPTVGSYFGCILDFILELTFGQGLVPYFGFHFGSILRPEPNKMRMPQEIRRKLILYCLEMFNCIALLGYLFVCILGGVWAGWKS